MKIPKILLGFFAGALLFTSCRRESSEDVNQDRIYAEYRIVYDAEQGKSFARANFKFGDALGTNLELSDPSSVRFNNDDLLWKPLFAYYEEDYVGLRTSGTFSFTDLDDNTFTNSVVVNNTIAFADTLTQIQKGAAYELFWDGAVLEQGETVTVTINGINERDIQVFTISQPGAQSIILERNKIDDLGIGLATIFMERVDLQSLQDGSSAGGAVWSRYIAEKKSIQITE